MSIFIKSILKTFQSQIKLLRFYIPSCLKQKHSQNSRESSIVKFINFNFIIKIILPFQLVLASKLNFKSEIITPAQYPQNQTIMSLNESPNNRVSRYSYQSSNWSDDQIQPFQIQPISLTHLQITKLIEKWDTFTRIQQKFGIWGLNFEFQKIPKIAPEQFYKTAIHYVFFKKLRIIIKQYNQTQLLMKSVQIKEIYKTLFISGKLKGRKFDYLLLICVKLIGFFFGSHIRQIIINHELESEIYTILIHVLLGTEVGYKAFSVVEQKYKLKPSLKYSRKSGMQKLTVLNMDSKNSSEHKQNKVKSTAMSKKRIGRCECRTGTALFYRIPEHQQDQNYRQIKELLKTNLFVKEFVPKPEPQQTLDEVLVKVLKSQEIMRQLNQAISLQRSQLKHKKLCYTQMSNSLDLNRSNESLNVLYNHSLKLKTQKKSKHYQTIKHQDLNIKLAQKNHNQDSKLPKISNLRQPEVYSYQAMVSKKKQGNYWKKIIDEMKANNFQKTSKYPPINTKQYFKNGQFDDQNKKNKQHEPIQSQNGLALLKNSNAEYLTQKVDTLRTQKTRQNLVSLKDVPSRNRTQKAFKTSLLTKTILQQPKNQINIIEYSTFANKQIYKKQKGSLYIYSNQPLQDMKDRLKTKSRAHLLEIQKKFQQECKLRTQKIQKSYFDLNTHSYQIPLSLTRMA